MKSRTHTPPPPAVSSAFVLLLSNNSPIAFSFIVESAAFGDDYVKSSRRQLIEKEFLYRSPSSDWEMCLLAFPSPNSVICKQAARASKVAKVQSLFVVIHPAFSCIIKPSDLDLAQHVSRRFCRHRSRAHFGANLLALITFRSR